MTRPKPKNIYYMLSYAYRVLTEGNFKNLEGEEFENINNLFAEIIYLGVSNQIKRGLTREYEEVTESIGTVRGKINIRESILGLSGKSDKLTCTFDEYSLDSPMNRVLKTSMSLLINADDVESDKKIKLKSLMKYFYDVETVDPFLINWDSFKYHRNNETYKMLMYLCKLIISGRIISDSPGTHKLSEFIDDQKMSALYERFIMEYFKKHHPEFNAARNEISWNYDKKSDNRMIDFLPKMITDVTLRYNNRVLIIDAKYYSEILKKSQYSDKEKFISSHLYQIFAYVKNKEAGVKVDVEIKVDVGVKVDVEIKGDVEGMLLYAGTEEELPEDLSLRICGNMIHLMSLDLSGDWNKIKDKLEKIARDFKGDSKI